MKRATLKNLIVLIALLCAHSASAWSGVGHQVIAAEAYKDLSPTLKTKVNEILKSHPDYQKWKDAYEKAGSQSFDLATYIFMRSSTWADEIRRGRGAEREYNHPHWHYVDYPLKPPSFPVEPGPTPNDDILFGIAHCETALRDEKEALPIRAIHLAYLIHLVGDMHQPLHCCSLVNSTYPNGDKGGNDFYVKPGSRGIKLHSLWDGMLGTSGKPQEHLNYASVIESKYPRKALPELTEHTTPKEWSLESRELAVEKAYLNGDLKGSTEAEDAPSLPDDYTKNAKVIAEKQAALAGYRLADEIGKWVK